jgi:hypothetical protein
MPEKDNPQSAKYLIDLVQTVRQEDLLHLSGGTT